MEVLLQAAQVTKAAYELINVHGLLTWLLQAAERRHLESQVLCVIIDLVHVLWFTNLGKKEARGLEKTPAAGDPPHAPAKCLPLPLINEFLCVLSAFIKHLQTGVKARQLAPFLQTLSSVLRHRGSALIVHQETGYTAVREQALSSTEALALLQRWGLLSHNASLLSALQGVAERHKMKDLLGNMKEKGRGKAASLRSRVRAEVQTEEVDEEVQEQEQAALKECEPHLRSIFTYWESLPPPHSPASDSQGHPGNCCNLSTATAHLLVKWMLRSLLAAAHNAAELLPFLRWVQTNIIPHKGTVAAMLSDVTVKQDFLRLYHKVCEPSPLIGSSAGPETVQLFTTVMVALLEAQGGPLGELHQAVLAACLSGSEEDDCRRGAGQLLLSIYVHELWSGALSPDLLQTHVKLVTGTRVEPKKTKRSMGQSTIIDICWDISSAADSMS